MIRPHIRSHIRNHIFSPLSKYGAGILYSYFWPLTDSLDEFSGMPGTVTRDSAASYIDVDGVLQISDGDDTPFSHDSIEDETSYTDIRGSFVDDQAWFDGAHATASLADYADTGNMLIIDDTSAKGYGYIGEAGTGETFTNGNLFDQDGGAGGSGDKGAFTLADLRLAEVSSGNLTVGTMYEISARDGEDFTADGAPDNIVGTTFVATGTNVTLDANDKVYPVDISWTPYGTNTIEIDDGALKISYVDNGNGAGLRLRDSMDFTDDLEVGKQYKVTGNAKIDNGDVAVSIATSAGDNPEIVIDSTTFIPFELYFIASSIDIEFLKCNGMAAGEEIWLDNLQISEVTAPSATAVKIYKETTLDNEGWNALDTGIDYNAGDTWDFDVYKNLMFEYPDLLSGWDFTSGWIAGSNASIDDTDSFTTTANAWIYKDISLVIGTTYKCTIVGSTTASNLRIYDGGINTIYNTGFGTFEFVAEDATIVLRNLSAGTTDITTFQVAQTEDGAQPRFETLGLLSEGEGTNYCLQSNGFDTTWAGQGLVTEDPNVTGPDGVVDSAWTVTDPGGTLNGRLDQRISGASISGTHTMSLFVKEGTSEDITVIIRDSIADTNRGDVDFQWVAGVLTEKLAGTGTSTIQQLDSTDWWRIQIHCPSVVAGNTHLLRLYPTENGVDPGSAVTTIFHGAQFEPTPYATSYIPTTTIPVTRTADAHSWTMSTAFKNLLGTVADSPFTMVVEFTPKYNHADSTGNEQILSVLDGESLFYTDEDGNFITSDDGGTDESLVDVSYVSGTTYTYILRVFLDTTMFYEVGVKDASSWSWDASPSAYDGSMNPALTFLIGNGNSLPLNVKNIYIYDEAKTQAWLENKH